MVLPPTYEVSGSLSFSNMQVVAYGGFSNAYKGSLGASDVCVKQLRVYSIGTHDRAIRAKQVPHPHHHSVVTP